MKTDRIWKATWNTLVKIFKQKMPPAWIKTCQKDVQGNQNKQLMGQNMRMESKTKVSTGLYNKDSEPQREQNM